MLNQILNLRSRLFGYVVVVVPVPTLKVQARHHPRKKRRLQKKWLKRYGYKTIIDPKVDLNTFLVDRLNRTVYCYPQQQALLLDMFQQV